MFGQSTSNPLQQNPTTFGQSTATFGTSNPNPPTVFGTKSPTAQNQHPFGQPAPTNATFGKTQTSPTFGQTKATFGQNSEPALSVKTVFGNCKTSSSKSGFGQTKPKQVTFGRSSDSNLTFGTASSSSSKLGQPKSFGTTKSPTSVPAFGSTALGNKTSENPFQQKSVGFGSSASSPVVFGQSKPAGAFGKPSNTTGPSTTFGSAATFGSNNSESKAGSSTFGSGASQLTRTEFGKTSFGNPNQTPAKTVFGKSSQGKKSTSKKKPQVPNLPAGIPPEEADAYFKSIGQNQFVGTKKRQEKNSAVMTKLPLGIQPEEANAYLQAVGQPTFVGSASMKKHGSTKKKFAAPSRSPSPSPPPSPPTSPGDRSAFDIGDNDDAQIDLELAENLDGTCVEMCSPVEAEFRTRVDELSAFEKQSDAVQLQPTQLIIKRFQRSSADHKLDIPSDIRPPGVLRRTMLYLEQELMDRDRLGVDSRIYPPRVPHIVDLYNFCWDRTRMIRKDFILQNYRGGGRGHPIVMDVHERIARYHITSEHELIEETNFVAQQNMEQLGQTLKSLNEYYDDAQRNGDPSLLSPHEAEFRGYFILCTLDNSGGLDVLKYVMGLSEQMRKTPEIEFAMNVFLARKRNDYFKFFQLLRSGSYLQNCLMHRYMPGVRDGALRCLNKAMKKQLYPLSELEELLCFEDLDHVIQVCEFHGLTCFPATADAPASVEFGSRSYRTEAALRNEKKTLPQRLSKTIISVKRRNLPNGAICRGITEYPQLPPLSKKIQELESEEEGRLYPNSRRRYQHLHDEYSSFEVKAPGPVRLTIKPPVPSPGPEQAIVDEEQEQRKRSLSVELEKQKSKILEQKEILQKRIATMEQQKQLKKQQEELAAKKEQEEKLLTVKKLEEAKRLQEETEKKEMQLKKKLEEDQQKRKKELELQRQQEKIEQERKRAEQERSKREQAQAEERRRQDLLELEKQRAEAARRKQLEAQQELHRQQEERLRREREEKLRKEEQLRREEERRKLERRREKQRKAILKFRFHQWLALAQLKRDMKTQNSSHSLLQSLKKMTMMRFSASPADILHRLFFKSHEQQIADSKDVRLPRPSYSLNDVRSLSEEGSRRTHKFWACLDIAKVVYCQFFPECSNKQRQRHRATSPTKENIAWKVGIVMASYQDVVSQSFSDWIRRKFGIPETDSYSLHQYPKDVVDSPQLNVCARMFDECSHPEEFQGTQSLFLPVFLNAENVLRWSDEHLGLVKKAVEKSTMLVSIQMLFVCMTGDLANEGPGTVRFMKELEVRYPNLQIRKTFIRYSCSAERRLSDLEIGLVQALGSCFQQIPHTIAVRKAVDFADFIEESSSVFMNHQLQESSTSPEEYLSQLERQFQAYEHYLLETLHQAQQYPSPELRAGIAWCSVPGIDASEGLFNSIRSACAHFHNFFHTAQDKVARFPKCNVSSEKENNSLKAKLIEFYSSWSMKLIEAICSTDRKIFARAAVRDTIEWYQQTRRRVFSLKDFHRSFPWSRIFQQVIANELTNLREFQVVVIASDWTRTSQLHQDLQLTWTMQQAQRPRLAIEAQPKPTPKFPLLNRPLSIAGVKRTLPSQNPKATKRMKTFKTNISSFTDQSKQFSAMLEAEVQYGEHASSLPPFHVGLTDHS